ncbi:MAG: sarcosine oxidase subunit alpha family protein [Proteobacteria bacterium]|nr:sarcosine oxidase subunit alpha family protein [Pseudomonadota bacterium]
MIFNRRFDQPFRLAEGGEIDRLAPVSFRFDGKTYQGYLGDTLASALLANGVRLVGRSFKYHRPRGIYSAGPEEPNALVELRTGGRHEPNTRATMIELFAGLDARSQNRWPNLLLDVMQLNALLSPVFVAGFYYKTFMGMPGWRFYEHFIRKAAGMGSGTTLSDPDSYDKMHTHCDVLVIGGGPAGIAAALAAGRSGARVMLLEESDALGGRLRSERRNLNGEPAMRWVRGAAAALEALDTVTVMTRTTGFGYYDGNVIAAVERISDHLATPPEHAVRQRLWHIRAGRVVIAAGATERPLVFTGNDRPGVMLASAARTYVNRFAVQPGKAAVVFANNDDCYQTALDLHRAGIEVQAVVDSRPDGHGAAKQQAETAGIECVTGAAVIASHGYLGLNSVDIAPISADGLTVTGPVWQLSCDLLAISGGWSPNVHLHSHAGGRPVYDPGIAAFIPGPSRQAERSAGAGAGTLGLADCLRQGAEVGAEAATLLGFTPPAIEIPTSDEPATGPLKALWRVPGPGKKYVDLQDDVTSSDVELAHREGYISVEHLKRYTTLGMGTDQGKTSNMNGHAIMAEERGDSIEDVGTTMFRPPYNPISLGAIAGRDIGMHFSPTRRSAMHDWHAENGAVFVEAGQWMRPQIYRRDGESDVKADMDRAISREVTETRGGVGMVDVSTLGKIDIQGPDSAEFLNRLYINGWKTLPVGRARYGLMLREDGIVFDDGTTSRVGENRYFMTTTTANAGPVMSHMEEYLQVHWPELNVKVVSVTEQWAAMALAGPKSRDVLAAAVEGLDVSNEALPFMGVRETRIAGVKARVFRISFSGELAYEINVPADHGRAVWERVMAVGAEHGIIPYGTEAMAIMRIEKGHVAGGELDGRTTADDLGLGRMSSSKKEYIGRRMADREGFLDPARPKFVGLVPVDGKSRARVGSVLVADNTMQPPVPMLGHISSSAYLSPTLGHPISLGLVEGGMSRVGETVWAMFPLRDEAIEVRIVDPVFYDKDGERLHA